jgi:hypothetical protein
MIRDSWGKRACQWVSEGKVQGTLKRKKPQGKAIEWDIINKIKYSSFHVNSLISKNVYQTGTQKSNCV